MMVGAPVNRSDLFTLWLESRRVVCRVKVGDNIASLDVASSIFD
jgi:hypothetical protein